MLVLRLAQSRKKGTVQAVHDPHVLNHERGRHLLVKPVSVSGHLECRIDQRRRKRECVSELFQQTNRGADGRIAAWAKSQGFLGKFASAQRTLPAYHEVPPANLGVQLVYVEQQQTGGWLERAR